MAYVVETCIGIGALILWILLIVVIIWRKFFSAARNENNDGFLKHFETGKKLRKKRNYDEAIKSFRKALRRSNGYFDFRDVYNELGACYYEKFDYERALTMFNISLAQDVTNLTALKWRSICLAKLEMYDQAYEDASIYDALIDESHSV
jgi:tetratricopeptide (TPR) repeat protein